MTAFATEMEWLRPLVNNHHWDYCVFWKLGDDPSRFIEWGACCCSGGKGPGEVKIKDEIDVEKKHLTGGCKDKFVKHFIRSKACKNLALLPSVIPLYSGIHGEVVISKRPRWTTQSNASTSDDVPNGTQVLIPVACGLIELFTAKQLPKDQKIIDHISAHFRASLKQERMTEKASHANFSQLFDLHSSVHIDNWLPSINFLQPNNYSSFEGSSTCSSLSNEHQLLKLGSDGVLTSISPEKSSKKCVDSPSSNPRMKRKKPQDSAFDDNEKVGAKIRQKEEKGPYKSKNLVTERKRRKRIKDGMLVLRSLVPKITKMDRIATLGDAADYIKELLETIENFHDELSGTGDEGYDKVNDKQDPPSMIGDCASAKTPILVEVEVIQIGTKSFLLRLISKQTRGGFSRLMETIDYLGLQVTDANITTLNGLVLNVLKVEAKTGDIEANTLEQSLVQMIN